MKDVRRHSKWLLGVSRGERPDRVRGDGRARRRGRRRG